MITELLTLFEADRRFPQKDVIIDCDMCTVCNLDLGRFFRTHAFE